MTDDDSSVPPQPSTMSVVGATQYGSPSSPLVVKYERDGKTVTVEGKVEPQPLPLAVTDKGGCAEEDDTWVSNDLWWVEWYNK